MNIEVIGQFLDFCSVYLVTLLGRSVLCSYIVLALVLTLRRTFSKNAVFFKGFLWSVFFLVPFVGKMRLFYENPFRKAYQLALSWQGAGHIAVYPLKGLAFLTRLFFRWGNLCVEQPWICRVYLLGALICFLNLWGKRRKVKQLVSKMMPYKSKQQSYLTSPLAGPMDIHTVVVSELMVTPFSTGLLHPKIVLPQVVLTHCSQEEIDLMILHEKIHIRLGHLWCYFLWDLLRSLFWLNPFLTVCMKYLQEDLEDICDRVTIQQSKRQPYEYGKLLLKTVQLLQGERMAFTMAFAGEKGYGEFKKRIQKIIAFRPYQKSRIVCLCGVFLFALLGMFAAITYGSYPKYVEMDAYLLVSNTGDRILMDDTERLKEAVSKDEKNIYIDRKAMDVLLSEQGINERSFYLGFGGYMKLPGMGGGGCSVYVDYEESQGNLVIPYQEQKDILGRILKVL